MRRFVRECSQRPDPVGRHDYRPRGKTGERVSAIGFGGAHIRRPRLMALTRKFELFKITPPLDGTARPPAWMG
jgi:hypothetical protein